MAKKQKVQKTKVKKRSWVQVFAPSIFKEQVVAEIPVYDKTNCVGKVVQSNMMTLTGDMRSQSVNAKLIITEVKENKAYSQITRYEITSPTIKRFVRRNRDRIDESLVYQTKDGVKVRIKPFLLTNNHAKGSTLTEMRKRLKQIMFKKVGSVTYDELFRMVVKKELQKEVRSQLSKLFPLRSVEIRVMHKEKPEAKITPSPLIKEKPVDKDEEEDDTEDNEVKKTALKKKAKKVSSDDNQEDSASELDTEDE